MSTNEINKLVFEANKLYIRHTILQKLLARIKNISPVTKKEATSQIKRTIRLVNYSKMLDTKVKALDKRITDLYGQTASPVYN